jgi:hypothetical protein
MFNSSVLDVALGVVFAFLAVSLITSAVVEAINSIFKLRSRSLLSGVKALVNDPNFTGLAIALYRHAAVNPRSGGASTAGGTDAPLKNTPAYIQPRQFANALLDITGLSAASATEAARAPGPQAVEALTNALDTSLADATNPQIKQLLTDIVQLTRGDIEQVRTETAAWFDGAMDRVGGAFKRWTQLISFIIAFLLAGALNVDTINVATVLWAQPTVANHLQVLACADKDCPDMAKSAADVIAALDNTLPIGWPPGRLQTFEGYPWAALLGWLVTAFATLFGAPFWFDMLQGFVRLKGAGPSPAEKQDGSAAAN